MQNVPKEFVSIAIKHQSTAVTVTERLALWLIRNPGCGGTFHVTSDREDLHVMGYAITMASRSRQEAMHLAETFWGPRKHRLRSFPLSSAEDSEFRT